MLVILDGAMGTEIGRRGMPVTLPLWSARALMDNPDLVRQIHYEYARAGADVLTTNTFRTQKRTFAKIGRPELAESMTRLAVRLAKEVAREFPERGIRIAGSVAPLEDCFRPELSPGSADDEFLELSEILMEEGCDFLLIETMNNIPELRSAIRAGQSLNVEYWTSVTPSLQDPLKLLSGEPLEEALRVCEGEGARVFLVNCAPIPVIEHAVSYLAERSPIPYGAYANNGTETETGEWRFDRSIPPGKFAEHAVRLHEWGASVIGGCCG
ncbi:MAG: homocysteine S-methyltransferase family protein, partial [Fimbriimonadales bacterium]|nr:homocysteine S-methyltransferase family protein [Fimbriimonadales bacterium]